MSSEVEGQCETGYHSVEVKSYWERHNQSIVRQEHKSSRNYKQKPNWETQSGRAGSFLLELALFLRARDLLLSLQSGECWKFHLLYLRTVCLTGHKNSPAVLRI